MLVIPISQETQSIPTQGIVFWEDYAVPNCHITGSTNVADLTNNVFTGTLTAGAAYSPVSASMAFLPGTAYVNTNYNTALQDFTCVAIYKCNSSTATGNYQRILDKNFGAGFWLGRSDLAANTWGGGILNGSPPYGYYSNTFTDGTWQMIGTSRAGTAQKIWNKGVVAASGACSGTALSTNVLTIGRDPTVAYGLGGYITAVLIYNRELTAAEMTQIYQYYSLRIPF